MTPHRREEWKQVRQLFEAALAEPAERRPAFIAASCHSQPEIGEQVAGLLASHGQASDFLEQPVGRPLGDLLLADADADPNIGRQAAIEDTDKIMDVLEGADILDGADTIIGRVTSGGFAPSLGRPIAMGYVPPAHAAVSTKLKVSVRGRAQSAEVAAMPFVPHRYVRKPA